MSNHQYSPAQERAILLTATHGYLPERWWSPVGAASNTIESLERKGVIHRSDSSAYTLTELGQQVASLIQGKEDYQ